MSATECSVEGCQRPAAARGWCSKHWVHLYKQQGQEGTLTRPLRSWTLAEIRILQRSYALTDVRVLARRLGRSPQAVNSKAISLLLTKADAGDWDSPQLAPLLGVTAHTIRYWIRRGYLRAMRVTPKRYRITDAAVLAFIASYPPTVHIDPAYMPAGPYRDAVLARGKLCKNGLHPRQSADKTCPVCRREQTKTRKSRQREGRLAA